MAFGAILAALGSAAATYGLNRLIKHDERKYNEAQADKAYERSLPSTQVKNLQDAGLNPNLVYGNIQPASYEAQRTPEQSMDVDFLKPLLAKWNREEQELGMEAKRLGNQRLELENEYLRQSLPDRVTANSLRNEGMYHNIINQQIQRELMHAKRRLTDKQYDALIAAIKKTESEVALNAKRWRLMDIEEAERELTLELNKHLKPYGVTTSDSYLMRLLATKLIPSLQGLDIMEEITKDGSLWHESKKVDAWLRDHLPTKRQKDIQWIPDQRTLYPAHPSWHKKPR